jgi:hypothetical protein
MPLPVGTWNITANGSTGTLAIGSDGAGGFNGTVFGQSLVGFFDETNQAFTFMRIESANLSSFQTYSGTLFKVVQTQNVGGTITQTTIYTLAGNFEAFPATGPISVFSWLAQMSQVVKEKEGSKDNKDNPDKIAKDSKDIPDRKNIKDNKGEKEHPPELIAAGQSGPFSAADLGTTVNQIMLRLSAVEQQMAVGQSFISPTERPAVGQQALDESRSEGTTKNT